jgi:glycine cleavage system aminomethyltransferase T/glycine/D-amino acid oxidase-like deaminating enzyme
MRQASRMLAGDGAAALPRHAKVVIMGGGIIGNSIAYHLGKLGWGKETVLLEQNQITSGTTWHAAGLMVRFGSLSETSTEWRKYTRQLYTSLEAETGHSTGFNPVGFMVIATDKDRLFEYRKIAAFNRKLGVPVDEISAAEVKRKFPLARTDDILAGFFVEGDGRANPVDAATSLSKGARQQGVRVFEGVRAVGTEQKNGRVNKVLLENGGAIECDYVVNAAGMWARQLAAASGVSLPNQACEHYYLITDPIPEVDKNLPVLEDPANYTYIRPEAGGLMLGLFEGIGRVWSEKSVSGSFSFGEIPADLDHVTPYLEAAMSRVPRSQTAGMKHLFCGPESFTPDLGPLIGEVPEVDGYFAAAGLNSIGILTGGGVGRCVAGWIVNGLPEEDVSGVRVDRFKPYQSTLRYRAQRAPESLGKVYVCHYPNAQYKTVRKGLLSPIYDRLLRLAPHFRDVSGWESPDWYRRQLSDAPGANVDAKPSYYYPAEELTFGRPSFFEHWKREHRAARENVALFDMSFMTKFVVAGKDAGYVLDRLSTAAVNGNTGETVYTQWLDHRGKLQADLTVTKLEDEKFMVVATDTMHNHTQAWVRRQAKREGKSVFVHDITSSLSQINLHGPNARKLMQLLTDYDMSNENFPFRKAQTIEIGIARVLCVRITYVGELGYELYIPAEQSTQVYDAICAAGAPMGLVHAGLRTLGSCRMEKAYRDYGHDIDNTDNLISVGLAFTADTEKTVPFIGRDAFLAEKQRLDGKAPEQRLLQVLCKDPLPLMTHGEVVYRDGVVVGDVRSASYGHSLGGAVGLAFVERVEGEVRKPANKDWIEKGKWELDIAGTRYPAVASVNPLFDPSNKKIKA